MGTIGRGREESREKMYSSIKSVKKLKRRKHILKNLKKKEPRQSGTRNCTLHQWQTYLDHLKNQTQPQMHQSLNLSTGKHKSTCVPLVCKRSYPPFYYTVLITFPSGKAVSWSLYSSQCILPPEKAAGTILPGLWDETVQVFQAFLSLPIYYQAPMLIEKTHLKLD